MDIKGLGIWEIVKNTTEKLVNVTPIKVAGTILLPLVLPHTTAIAALVFLILIDTILGSWLAVRGGFFSSQGMKKTVVKIILYSMAITAVKAVVVLIGTKVYIGVETMFVYLSLIEVKSIFENLIKMGLPIPHDLLSSLVKKIPFLSSVSKEMEIASNDDIKVIDKMSREFFSVIRHKALAKLLRINVNVWREFSENVLSIKVPDTEVDVFAQAVLLEAQIAMRVCQNRWEDNKISTSLLDAFLKDNTPKTDMSHEVIDICNKLDTNEERKKAIISLVTNHLRKVFENVLKTKYKL